METLSTWALRIEGGADGQPLSDKQIANWQRWGALRIPPDGRWLPCDVKRIRHLRELGKEVRSVPRCAIRLFDPNYQTQPGKLRESMMNVAGKVSAPVRKMRRVGTAISLPYEREVPRPASRRSQPNTWRLPPEQWGQILSRFNDDDFCLIAGSAISHATSLFRNPSVSRSGVLSGIPLEELIILLTIRQLAIGDELKAGSSLP